MGERRGLEAELQRLGRMEFEAPRPKEGIFGGKKKRPRPKGGPPGQMGKVAPAATGLYEPPEEELKNKP